MNSNRRAFNEDEARTILIQLLLSIDLMHRNGILHRDIKPDNILMCEEDTLNVCITDLGMACRLSE
jgi:serine/threonine protein kinase